MNIEIKDDELNDIILRKIADYVANYYLNAYDVDYDKQNKESAIRYKKIIKDVNWQKLSQETFTDIAKEMIANKILNKGDKHEL